MPGVILSIMHISTHLILIITLLGRHYPYPQFTDEETEAKEIKQLASGHMACK